MEKISIQELGDVFATRTKLSAKDAERLVRAMFSLIRNELAKGNPVKVRGLGTFKIIDVDSRESVNVTTGERIVIESHEKLTFVPDATMKELVNRPFSQFDTVVLNDGVDFSDAEFEEGETDQQSGFDEEATERPQMVEDITEGLPEQQAQTLQVDVTDGIADDGDAAVESVEGSEEVGVADVEHGDDGNESDDDSSNVDDGGNVECNTENANSNEQAINQNEEVEEESLHLNNEDISNKSHSLPKRILSVLVCVVLACCLVYLGYFYGRNKHDIDIYVSSLFNHEPEPIKAAQTIAVVAAKPDSSLSKGKERVEEQTPAKDSLNVEGTDTTAQQFDSDIYAERDARVRTGAYRIVGTDYEVSIKKGETLKRISDRALGPDMECYVEAYNNITTATELKEGEKLKIPKLELKKRRKASSSN